MHVHIYIYMFTNIHIYMYIHICICIYILVHLYLFSCKYGHKYIYMFRYKYFIIYIHAYIYTYIYIYVFDWLCAIMCIYVLCTHSTGFRDKYHDALSQPGMTITSMPSFFSSKHKFASAGGMYLCTCEYLLMYIRALLHNHTIYRHLHM